MENQILVNTATIWGNKPEDFLNLYLENGTPVAAVSDARKVVADRVRINDGEWHHLALVMPHDHSKLSDLQLYLNGEPVETSLKGRNTEIAFNRHMRVNIGCKGYSHRAMEKVDVINFEGELDEVILWTRPILPMEIQTLALK